MNTKTTPAKKRIGWIDIARCLSLFTVVLGHCFDKLNFLQQVLYIFNLPFFFFLSGLTYRYDKNQLGFFIKKLRQLYIPYLLTALVSIFIYLLVGPYIGLPVGFNAASIKECLFGMLYANTSVGNMMWNRPLWFLPALFVALIITNLLEGIKIKPIRYFCLIFLSALGYWISYNRIFLPLQSESALCMLIWIYTGRTLKGFLFSLEDASPVALTFSMILLSIIGIGVGFYNGTISVMVGLYGRSVFLYMIPVLTMSIALCILSILIRNNRLLEYIGRNTLVILLWHKFPIEFFQKVCPGFKEWLVSDNTLVVDGAAIVVSIIAIFSSLLLKIIYLKFLKLIRKA